MSSRFKQWVQEYEIEPSPLIHVGAHLAEERFDYQALGFLPVLWVEAHPDIAAAAQVNLTEFSDQYLISSALWSSAGIEKKFFVAGDEGSSSSLLEPYLITASHPNVKELNHFVVTTSTLDLQIKKSKLEHDYRIVVLDVQGAEIEVLRGAMDTIKTVDVIISEVSRLELYKGTARLDTLVEFLAANNFDFVASEVNRATGWGEGLFIRRKSKIVKKYPINNHIVVGKYIALGRLIRTVKIRLNGLVATRKKPKK